MLHDQRVSRWGQVWLARMIAAILLSLSFLGCGRSSGTGKIVNDTAGNPVRVLALTDPRNPYKDSYLPWDMWVYEHLGTTPPKGDADTEARRLRRSLEDQLQERVNVTGLSLRVTPEGYLEPLLDGIKLNEARRGMGQASSLLTERWVVGKGEMDPGMYTAMHQATNIVHAAYYNSIPRWLAENPPEAAMFPPNGDVITRGMLGDGAKLLARNQGVLPTSLVFARYSKDGVLLRRVDMLPWWCLYSMEGETLATPPGAFNDMHGCMGLDCPEGISTMQLLATGKRGTSTALPPDLHPFTFLTVRQIIDYYEAQQDNKAAKN